MYGQVLKELTRIDKKPILTMQWEYEIMTKYNINYRKVDKEQEKQEQQSYFKDLAHKCLRSKILCNEHLNLHYCEYYSLNVFFDKVR